jgi:oligosaccharide reducing-end xylanase
VDELWNAGIPSGRYRYYDGMWYLMALLHVSGQYRVWTPKGLPQPSGDGGLLNGATSSTDLKTYAPPLLTGR